MSRYPRAVSEPAADAASRQVITPRLLILHASSCGATPHLRVEPDGRAVQLLESTRRAEGMHLADPFAFNVHVVGSASRLWTSAQVDRLVDVAVWAQRVHDLPLRRAGKWDGAGVGCHDDYPRQWNRDTPLAACPGGNRRTQAQEVIDRAHTLVHAPPPELVDVSVATLPVVRVGARGKYVRIVQGCLLAASPRLRANPAEVGADGVFDPQTERVLRAFQKAQGLRPDGVVGRATWRHLIGAN